jgi:hypothetical protein
MKVERLAEIEALLHTFSWEFSEKRERALHDLYSALREAQEDVAIAHRTLRARAITIREYPRVDCEVCGHRWVEPEPERHGNNDGVSNGKPCPCSPTWPSRREQT